MIDRWDLDGFFLGMVEGEPVNCRIRMRLTESGSRWEMLHEPDTGDGCVMTYVGEDSRHRASRLLSQMRAVQQSARAVDLAPGTSRTGRVVFLDVGPASDRSSEAAGTTAPPHPASQDQTG